MEYGVSTQYRDRLFRFLFGNEKYKKHTLELYNALNETSYTDESELELVTLQDVIYIRMHNDVAVMLSGNMELWEHQSTVNPNMPIRGLMYFARLYEKYIVNTMGRHVLYKNSLIELPTPRYIVFYNGSEERSAIEKLYLSSAFTHKDTSGEFEWTATVLNLNHEDNRSFLKKCGILLEYTDFVQDVQEYRKTMEDSIAVDLAVKRCIERGGVLAGILLEHRAEVVDMLLTEFNEEEFVKTIREEAVEEGKKEGMKEGKKEGIKEGIMEGIRNGVRGVAAMCSSLGMSEDSTLQKICELYPLSRQEAMTCLHGENMG